MEINSLEAKKTDNCGRTTPHRNIHNNEIIVECCIGIQLNLYEYQLIYVYLNYPPLQTRSMLYEFAEPLIKEISELIAKHSSLDTMLYSFD